MSEPWTRADVARELTGGVLVDTPHPGATVTSPFTVTGGAWGMWADFTTTVTVDAEPGPIELVAYDAGGCGDDPECPPIIETVAPLTLG